MEGPISTLGCVPDAHPILVRMRHAFQDGGRQLLLSSLPWAVQQPPTALKLRGKNVSVFGVTHFRAKHQQYKGDSIKGAKDKWPLRRSKKEKDAKPLRLFQAERHCWLSCRHIVHHRRSEVLDSDRLSSISHDSKQDSNSTSGRICWGIKGSNEMQGNEKGRTNKESDKEKRKVR